VNFRDMTRTTVAIYIIGGRLVKNGKGEETPIWNHDEVVRNNIFLHNKHSQINFGINGINANRLVPQRLLGSQVLIAPGKKRALDAETKLAEDFVDKQYGQLQPKGLFLEKLNFSFDGNIYWSGTAVPLMMWKGLLEYVDLQPLSAAEGFEKNGAILDPQFANWREYDLRVPEGSPLITKGCYPRGDVPGVRLGVMKKGD